MVCRCSWRVTRLGGPGRRTLTACVLQPDQAVEEVVQPQLEALVGVPEHHELQEAAAQPEAWGQEAGSAQGGHTVDQGSCGARENWPRGQVPPGKATGFLAGAWLGLGGHKSVCGGAVLMGTADVWY